MASAFLAIGVAAWTPWSGDEPAPTNGPEHPPETRVVPIARPELARGAPPRREPAYGDAVPRYCEVLIGQGEALTRHWIVDCGDHVYADVDGDGDLTSAEERFSRRGAEAAFDLASGGARYPLTQKAYESGARVLVLIDTQEREWCAWGDERGQLFFSDKAEGAPVVRFCGPLEMGIDSTASVRRKGHHDYQVSASVGCRGHGPGTFAHLRERHVPKSAKPFALVRFDKLDESSVVVRADLDGRC